jgi:LPXTG-motif cell wall-anchored protein
VAAMTFIERLFGFSPDHNTGGTEAAIFFAIAAVLIGLLLLYYRPGRSNL